MAKSATKKTIDSTSVEKKVSPLSNFLSHRMFEGIFIFALAFSAFLSLSLWSFHLETNAFTFNAGGRAGAYLSYAFFSALGYVAYLYPFIFSYVAFCMLKKGTSLLENTINSSLKFAGLLLFTLSFCSIASLIGLSFSQTLPNSGGGTIGIFFARSLYDLFDMAGSLVILIGFGLTGITLTTNVSWLSFFEFLGELLSRCVNTILGVPALIAYAKKGILMLFAPLIKIKQYLMSIKLPTFKRQDNTAKPFVRDTSVKSAKANVDSDIENIELNSEKEDPFLTDNFFGSPPVIPAKVKVSEQYKEQPKKEAKRSFFKPKSKKAIPSLSLLSEPKLQSGKKATYEELEQQSRDVEQKLLDFGVEVKVVAVHPGPVITRFELQLAPGLKVSKITALGKDLARSLSVIGVRVVEVIPGKSVIGLELPNLHRDMVTFGEVLSTKTYAEAESPLSLALGVDIAGKPMVVNLAKMPHLLVAGTTGSGKSVGINAMLLSLLFKATPDEVRLILVDPKMLELSIYDGIPHLLAPVVTDMKDAARALRWCVMEMERRYRLMAAMGVRNLLGFNKKVQAAIEQGEPLKDPLWQGLEHENAPELNALPNIVVVIDELADMMMVVGKKVEQLIARIAQKARAAGIHLILATQRPSVDVLTGLIKSNIPTRIAFQVSSKIDSRTILDQGGAEQLLGHGDMLYLAPGAGAPIRVHGAFVDDNEVHRVADAWRALGEPDYIDDITNIDTDSNDEFGLEPNGGNQEEVDALYDEAIAFVTQARKASISSVQRRFKIGYNRAARLVEEMERTGVVGPMEGGMREVLAPAPPSEVDA